MDELQTLLREWAAKRAVAASAAVSGPTVTVSSCDCVAALDAATRASHAYSGALPVHFSPAQLADALATMHEHVLCRVQECCTETKLPT